MSSSASGTVVATSDATSVPERHSGFARPTLTKATHYAVPPAPCDWSWTKEAISTPLYVLYGDSLLDVSIEDVTSTYREAGLPALMTVFRNEHRWEESNAVFDGRHVTKYESSRPRHRPNGLRRLRAAHPRQCRHQRIRIHRRGRRFGHRIGPFEHQRSIGRLRGRSAVLRDRFALGLAALETYLASKRNCAQ